MPYVLVKILLPRHYCRFTHLEAHLRRLVVHEAPKGRRKRTTGAALLPVRIPSIRCALAPGSSGRSLGRRRGPHHRYGRDMLRDWMVERR